MNERNERYERTERNKFIGKLANLLLDYYNKKTNENGTKTRFSLYERTMNDFSKILWTITPGLDPNMAFVWDWNYQKPNLQSKLMFKLQTASQKWLKFLPLVSL